MKTNLLTDKDLKVIQGIIKTISKDSNAHPFKEPVDYKGLKIDDYIKIIRKPMDLSTVQNKLKQKIYESVHVVFEDIQLIWDNCKRYNIEGSDIYKQADHMENITDELIKKNNLQLPSKSKFKKI